MPSGETESIQLLLGTLYLIIDGFKGTWGQTENNREGKSYAITKSGQKTRNEETRWRKMAGLVVRLLQEETQ